MTPSDRMTEDSFEKARAEFFGTAITTPLENESVAECPKTAKDTSREDGGPKA
jgi:hypothetical protein